MQKERHTQAMVNVHSAAVHIENKVDLLSRQAWFYLLYRAFPKLSTQTVFSISLAELKDAIGYHSKNNKYLREALAQLVTTAVRWNIFEKDKEQIWGVSGLLAHCEIRNHSGYCEYSFSYGLQKQLFNPSMYVKLNLLVSKKFTSKHSLAIYCLALDYLNVKQNYGKKTLTITELRYYLGIEEALYPRVVDIHRRILKKAEADINKDSDIMLTIQPIRSSRNKIIAFKFSMAIKEEYLSCYQSNTHMPLSEALPFATIGIQEDTDTTINQGVALGTICIEHDDIQRFLMKHAISLSAKQVQDKLRELNNQLPDGNLEHYLLYLIDYTNREQEKGLIKNVAGFFITLLQQDSQRENYCCKIQEVHRDRVLQEQRAREAEEKELRNRYSFYTAQEFKRYLEKEYNQYQAVFVEIISKEIPVILRDAVLKRNGGTIDLGLLENPMIIGTLMRRSELFGYMPLSFEEWKQDFWGDSAHLDEDQTNCKRHPSSG